MRTRSDGVLADPSGAVVVKPCKEAELDFYESIASHPELAEFIPKFMGNLALGPPDDSDPQHALLTETSDPELAELVPKFTGNLTLGRPNDSDPKHALSTETSDPVVVETGWAPSGGGAIVTNKGVVLENVTENFTKPNVLDVKLGARLWADDAPQAKREKLEKQSSETTSGTLGLRIAGMRIWQGLQTDNPLQGNVDGYMSYDKDYGRQLTAENVHQGFEKFFLLKDRETPSNIMTQVILRFVKDLKGLQHVVENEESRMYSSSVLFVYEGDSTALQQAFQSERDYFQPSRQLPHEVDDDHEVDNVDEVQLPAIQVLKLIDFAHAKWTPGQGADENMLHGIANVIAILEKIVAKK